MLLQGSFSSKVTCSGAENFFLTSDYGVHVITIDMKYFVPLWHQGLYPSREEIGGKCQMPGGDSLLHVGTLPAVLISCPLIPVCLDGCSSVWLASNLCWNNADMKEAVTSWQQALDITSSMLGTCLGAKVGHMHTCQW
jgi:hypothetical protein